MFKKFILLIALLTITAPLCFGEGIIVFSGTPVIKISEGGLDDRIVEKIKGEKSLSFKCVISKIGDKYYWTTRGNVELVPTTSGTFITFSALNGSGYVRIIPKDLKNMASLMGLSETKYDYVEHLLIGLKSVTYYGIVTK